MSNKLNEKRYLKMDRVIICILCLLKMLLIFSSCAIPLFGVMAIITRITDNKYWATKLLKRVVK